MLLIEGGWYCPSIPDVLITASIDFDAGVIDEPTFRDRLTERWRYQIITRLAPTTAGMCGFGVRHPIRTRLRGVN